MTKLIWILLLAALPIAAIKFDAPKWFCLLAAAPFLIYLMFRKEDDDSSQHGEGFAKFRTPLFIAILLGGILLASDLFRFAGALFR
jgi:hypothetical protein